MDVNDRSAQPDMYAYHFNVDGMQIADKQYLRGVLAMPLIVN